MILGLLAPREQARQFDRTALRLKAIPRVTAPVVPRAESRLWFEPGGAFHPSGSPTWGDQGGPGPSQADFVHRTRMEEATMSVTADNPASAESIRPFTFEVS